MINKILDDLIQEAREYPGWKAVSALRCAKKELLKEIDFCGKWISVKDGLPEERINPNTNDFKYVLCATTFGDTRAYKYGMMDGNTEAHFWHGFGIMDKYVTHWMPSPEPPKEV